MIRIVLLLLIGVLVACSGKTDPSTQRTEQTSDTLSQRLEILNQKIKEDPNNAGLYYERAQIFMIQKLLDKGTQDMELAVKLDSSNVKYHLSLSDFYYATNKIEPAKNSILKAISLEPENIEANIKMGELQFILEDYPNTFKYLDAALRKDPFNAKVYFIKGMAFRETGDTNLALSSFRTTIEQDPDYFNAYMMIANIYAAQRNPLAIDYYNNAIYINPQMVEAHYGLAYYLQENGKPDGAIKVYNDLLSIDPKNAPALHNIGYIFLFEKNDPQAAVVWFNKAIDADSKAVNAVYHRGLAYEMLGEFGKAKTDYTEALRLDSNFDLPKQRLQRLK